MHISAFTDDDYRKLSDYQNGMCELCQTKPRKLVVDYDRSRSREYGKVRGLLCRRCFNGSFSKSKEFLLKVSNYLLDTPADRVFE
jgi:recombination endonuclease VII